MENKKSSIPLVEASKGNIESFLSKQSIEKADLDKLKESLGYLYSLAKQKAIEDKAYKSYRNINTDE